MWMVRDGRGGIRSVDMQGVSGVMGLWWLWLLVVHVCTMVACACVLWRPLSHAWWVESGGGGGGERMVSCGWAAGRLGSVVAVVGWVVVLWCCRVCCRCACPVSVTVVSHCFVDFLFPPPFHACCFVFCFWADHCCWRRCR